MALLHSLESKVEVQRRQNELFAAVLALLDARVTSGQKFVDKETREVHIASPHES